ncbi:isoleucine--tRNA ligase [Patescibacteria group bacterium]|nr:isoleucine--tRNA ligase [Patescibacteria group bacterium]
MSKINFIKIEEKILDFWKQKKIFTKLRKKNAGGKAWSFLDGPITANNPMGVHHAWGRTYKDIFQRYKAMNGYDQRYQNGFDCQGLWVEVEVEKDKGFKTKKDIETYGIEKFVNDCKQRVTKYSDIQTQQSIRLGQWMDWDNSYYTMSDENNYAIWNFLKKCKDKQILYKGKDVVPWCIRCGTAISQHEILTEEYKEVSHKSIFFKLPIKGSPNTFFMAWTTTPWTLPANVALAVHPELNYVKIQDRKDNNIYVLLESKSELVVNGKIIDKFVGEKLIGMEYEGMFDNMKEPSQQLKSYKHSVISWDEVTEEEGTGIVHIAPGCGQEDFQLSKEFNIPVIDPTNKQGKYKQGFDFLTDRFVTEVNEVIFDDLTKRGFVFDIKDYQHRYPTCWRCKSELIFRLVDEWYISMKKLRKPLAKAVKKIKWLPKYGLDRELDWLKNMSDWLISKKRYWGLALPIYECTKCKKFEVIGSKQELQDRAIEGWVDFSGHSPHRPWVDKVKIKCSKCDNKISRILDVGNPWLDAGIVPFSTIKYYSDKKYWEKWFPPHLVCESFPGQFKNWFYSLIVMSVVLEDCPPVETIFGYALVKDEHGEEMHKSAGNAIWFDDAVTKTGVDAMRWLYFSSNPFNNLYFGFNNIQKSQNKLLVLWNIFVFYKTHGSKIIKAQPMGNVLDKWIISKLNNLILKTTSGLDEYNTSFVAEEIAKFLIKDFSRWYLRMSRNRFRDLSNQADNQQANYTLYFVLLNLIKLLAPITPFLAEEIYLSIKQDNDVESVHLFSWPKADQQAISKDMEDKMSLVREICEIGHSIRVKAGIKVRQPLSCVAIKSSKMTAELENLIKKELNVKKVDWVKKIPKSKDWVMVDDSDILMALNIKLTAELEEEGIIREVVRQVNSLRKKNKLTINDTIEIYYETTSQRIKEVIKKNLGTLKKNTISSSILDRKISNDFSQKQIKINNQVVVLAINV